MKYAFLGPESTGKTQTALAIAERINGIYVPEMARGYLSNIGLNYTYEDIIEIALLQISEELNWEEKTTKTLICDTELITIQIWLEYYKYTVPEWLITQIKEAEYQQYFLFDIDVPWIADGLRANGHDRAEIMALFIEKLDFYKKNYIIIRGLGEERVENVLHYIARDN